jgi:hypothetical protein
VRAAPSVRGATAELREWLLREQLNTFSGAARLGVRRPVLQAYLDGLEIPGPIARIVRDGKATEDK